MAMRFWATGRLVSLHACVGSQHAAGLACRRVHVQWFLLKQVGADALKWCESVLSADGRAEGLHAQPCKSHAPNTAALAFKQGNSGMQDYEPVPAMSVAAMQHTRALVCAHTQTHAVCAQ